MLLSMLARRPLGGLFRSQLCRRFAATAESEKEPAPSADGNTKQREVVLGEIDKIIPDLHKNPLADILRDADFEAQVKPVIETLQALGLKEKTMSVLANKKPKALLIRPENDKNTNALELLRYLKEVRGVKDDGKVLDLVSRRVFLYDMPLKRIAAQIDLLKHQLDLSEVAACEAGKDGRALPGDPATLLPESRAEGCPGQPARAGLGVQRRAGAPDDRREPPGAPDRQGERQRHVPGADPLRVHGLRNPPHRKLG